MLLTQALRVWSIGRGLRPCFAMGAGNAGRLKSILRFCVMTSLCLNPSRQIFPRHRAPTVSYNQDHLAQAYSA